ncbi:hypothetical protein J6590_101296, partial [Homalodisca vitripennis]
ALGSVSKSDKLADQCIGGVECRTELNDSTSHCALSLISGIEDAGMESISLVLAGVSAEAEVVDKDDNGVPSDDKTTGARQWQSRVIMRPRGRGRRQVGVPIGGNHWDDRRFLVTRCGPVCPPITDSV